MLQLQKLLLLRRCCTLCLLDAFRVARAHRCSACWANAAPLLQEATTAFKIRAVVEGSLPESLHKIPIEKRFTKAYVREVRPACQVAQPTVPACMPGPESGAELEMKVVSCPYAVSWCSCEGKRRTHSQAMPPCRNLAPPPRLSCRSAARPMASSRTWCRPSAASSAWCRRRCC